MADIPLHAMNPSHKSQQQADSSDSEEGDARDGNGEDEGNDFVAGTYIAMRFLLPLDCSHPLTAS